MPSKFLINLSLTVGISSLLFFIHTESLSIFSSSSTLATLIEANKLTSQELETIAKAITVKVHVGEYRGSGILIQRDSNIYTVITNAHVTDRGDLYQIETSDGVKHPATLTSQDSSEAEIDLAVLEFNSSNKYQVASLGELTKLKVGDRVIAAGFPFDTDKLRISTGKISLLPDKSLEGGYQIGLTNETLQGMSGGVLLNSIGEVIGVLGKGKGAIFDSAYNYSDGTRPTTEELDNLRDASFSIPIAKVVEIAPSLAAIFPETPVARTSQQPTEILTQTRVYTGIVGQVDNIARQITVRIDNLTEKSNGSGVIIAKQGNNYYVATAKHVLCNNLDTPKCEANGQHQIVTPDGVTHKLDYRTVEAPETWLDVAVFRFESKNNYSVAKLGKYDVGDKRVFVSGFPRIDPANKTQPKRLLTGGKVRKKEEKDFNVKDAYSLKDTGDGLVYSNISYGGMSGGAVLDARGRLVGINTGAENEIELDEDGNYEQLQLGYSLGVPIQDFLGLVQKEKMDLKLQWLQIETNPAPEITEADLASITEQLLTNTEPSTDAEIVAWMNYGNQLWRYGKYAEAVNAFQKAIELEPNFDKAYYAMGLAFLSQEDYEQAASAFNKAVDINPTPYYYWRRLGNSYWLSENYPEAKAAYKIAISKNPEDFVLYVEQGDVLRESTDYQAALDSYARAISLNSDHPWAYNNRGVAYSDSKQYDKALADFTRIIKINPQAATAYNNRGTVYYDCCKQYEKAIANFTQAIEIDPQYDEPYYNRGLAYADLEQYDKAIANYTKAIELNSQYALSYNNRGNIYHDLKQYDKAIADYERAIKIEPNSALAYNNRGFVYNDLEQYDKALADYERAIKINPNFAEAYNNRGATYHDLKQYDKALADFTKAIAFNPNFAEAYNNRGLTYYDLGQYSEAVADHTKAIKINPRYVMAYNGRAAAYEKLKQYSEAIADFSQVIDIEPQNAHAYLMRGIVYAFSGNFPQGRQDLERAATLFKQQNNLQWYETARRSLKNLSQLETQQ